MGKRGVPRTPTAVLRARGSWLAKTRDGEPQATGEPVAPSWMMAEAQAAWDQIIPALANMGVAKGVDANALSRYCTIFARWRECEEFLIRHGTTFPLKNSEGKLVEVKEFPQVGRSGRLADQLLRLEQQFGMTPSARANLVGGGNHAERNSDKGKFFGKPKLAS